jgi:hypothetical protein
MLLARLLVPGQKFFRRDPRRLFGQLPANFSPAAFIGMVKLQNGANWLTEEAEIAAVK